MPIFIVDGLEVIQIDHHNGARMYLAEYQFMLLTQAWAAFPYGSAFRQWIEIVKCIFEFTLNSRNFEPQAFQCGYEAFVILDRNRHSVHG